MIHSSWIVVALFAGFLLGAGLVIQAEINLNAKIVEAGLFTNGGHVYRLVEIKP